MIIDKINIYKSNLYNILCNCKVCSVLKKFIIIGGLDL